MGAHRTTRRAGPEGKLRDELRGDSSTIRAVRCTPRKERLPAVRGQSKGAAKAAERRSKAGMGRLELQGAPGRVCGPQSPPVLTPAGTCWAQPEASSPIRVAGRAQPFTHSPAPCLTLSHFLPGGTSVPNRGVFSGFQPYAALCPGHIQAHRDYSPGLAGHPLPSQCPGSLLQLLL